MIRIEISNRQSLFRLARSRIRPFLTFLLGKFERPENLPGNMSLTLIVTDNHHMPEFKRLCFGIHEVTDVIATSYDPMPHEGVWEAELVVNAERAADVVDGRIRCTRLAHLSPHAGQTWDLSCEFALYLAHGIDHLSGADDASPRERHRMRQRELKWLRDATRRGLLSELLTVTGSCHGRAS